jgi:hypothetical protein
MASGRLWTACNGADSLRFIRILEAMNFRPYGTASSEKLQEADSSQTQHTCPARGKYIPDSLHNHWITSVDRHPKASLTRKPRHFLQLSFMKHFELGLTKIELKFFVALV